MAGVADAGAKGVRALDLLNAIQGTELDCIVIGRDEQCGDRLRGRTFLRKPTLFIVLGGSEQCLQAPQHLSTLRPRPNE